MSGVFLKGSNGGDLIEFAPGRGSVAPGEYWLYSNWDFNVSGYIFEKQIGKLDDFSRQFY
jgi:CubicO group peptidase (beta-lactamase class C family)